MGIFIDILRSLKLLLPALVPSWRFFDVIAASPRIEFRVWGVVDSWREFRPRPVRLSFGQMLGRLVWNPRWNESLFLVSCAERIAASPTEHSCQEIVRRIRAELGRDSAEMAELNVQFRLVFVQRDGGQLRRRVMFVSTVYAGECGGEL